MSEQRRRFCLPCCAGRRPSGGLRLLRGGTWFLVLALALGAGASAAEETPPTKRVGIATNQLQFVDLGPEIEGMQGRHLRLRSGTLEPGGHNAIHTHADRPEVLYVLEGTILEHRDGVAIERPAGTSFFGDKQTNHWIENKGPKRASFLVVDIVKDKP